MLFRNTSRFATWVSRRCLAKTATTPAVSSFTVLAKEHQNFIQKTTTWEENLLGNTHIVSAMAIENFVKEFSALDSSLRFRLVPQGSPIKFLYQVIQENEKEKDEWIPVCLKTKKRHPSQGSGYVFTFPRVPVVDGMGMVMLGREPYNTFLMPSNAFSGKTQIYLDPKSPYAMKSPNEVRDVLKYWWESKSIPRVTPISWVQSLFSSEHGFYRCCGKHLLLKVMTQIEKIIYGSVGIAFDYSGRILMAQKFRGVLCDKEICFTLASPQFNNTTIHHKTTFGKQKQQLGDFLLIIPHKKGDFDRFFLFPRDFVMATLKRPDVKTWTYYVYGSDQHLAAPQDKMQKVQERFEIKCDQKALQLLPGYEQKFWDILNNETV